MGVQAYYNVIDGKGQTSLVAFDLPTSTTAVNAVAFCKSAAPVVRALISGGLVSAGVRYDVPITGWDSADADPDADVQEKALFSFRSAANFIKEISLPTILETVFSVGSKFVDVTTGGVPAFITMMIDGIDTVANGGTGVVQPTTSHSEDLISLAVAREDWGKYRK